MDSLYGGQPGVSFTLKASFSSIENMKTAFKGGANYTDVWYGEYCIIDTPNKNDKDNGKIYKRGFNYTDNLGGAEYLGQIVGPSSGTPYFAMDSISSVKKQASKDLSATEYRRFPTGKDSNGNYVTASSGDIATFEFGNTEETNSVLVAGKDSDGNFNDTIKYTWVNIRNDDADSDSWFYVGWEIPYLVVDYTSVTNSPYDESGYIADNSTSVTRIDDKTHPFYEQWELGIPHGIKGDSLKNLRVIVPTKDDKIYPWDAIETNNKGQAYLKSDATNYSDFDDDVDKQRKIVVFDYWLFDKQQAGEVLCQIYLGDFNIIKSVDVAEDGTLTIGYTHDDNSVFDKKIKWVQSIKLGTTGAASVDDSNRPNGGGAFRVDFNDGTHQDFQLQWIKDIEIADDGSLTRTYVGNAAESDTVRNRVKWITDVDLNTAPYDADSNDTSGDLTVTFNTKQVKDDGSIDDDAKNETFQTTLQWVTDADLNDNGDLIFTYVGHQAPKVLNNKLKWIKSVSFNQETGKLAVSYNYGDSNSWNIPYVKDITISEDGNISIGKASETAANNTEYTTLSTQLKNIQAASIASDGIVTFQYNTGDTINLKNGLDQYATDYPIKMVNDVKLNSGLVEDKHIQVAYNTSYDKNNNEYKYTSIGDPINYIQKVQLGNSSNANNSGNFLTNSSRHLYVLFSDPTYRSGLDVDSRVLGTSLGYSENSAEGKAYWQDFGSIQDTSGVLVGVTITEEEMKQDSAYSTTGMSVKDFLNARFPLGLTGNDSKYGGANVAGKLITYIDSSGKSFFYAFDYSVDANNKNTGSGWVELGSLEVSEKQDVMLLNAGAEDTEGATDNLDKAGILFQTKSVEISTGTMPTFWA